MKLKYAKVRKNEVLMIDSINSSEADFLATHIPFRKITYKEGLSVEKNSIPEKEVFFKIFQEPSSLNKHQLIVVDGSSGSGKSHFIRWVYAQLKANSDLFLNDEILLIRRSDNTLKGTIKQLLNIEAIKNLKNKEYYERLVKANSIISEKKFKDEIFHKFIVEIDNTEESNLSSLERKRLSALLNDQAFKAKIMDINGPIERIFSKIAESTNNLDVIAQFELEDFIIDNDLYKRITEDSSTYAKNLAKYLTEEQILEDNSKVLKIVEFLNSKVDIVIQNCAGIQKGDFEQIFKEIRQELFKNGKNLILLIEDITSFTGINQELLNVLVTSHTGLNSSENMCKLISIIGTTTEYFKLFRDNYKDRITSQITIEDGTIGQNSDDLYLFFAKYLNATSIDSNEIEEWRINGANEEDLPVHLPDINWDSYGYYNKSFSLYPFTKTAIIKLYNSMEEHKTPRYILRDIIEPAINEIISDKNMFLTFLEKRKAALPDSIVTRINKTVDLLQITGNKEAYRKRSLALFSYWGNYKLEKKSDSISGIFKYIFEEFNLVELYNALYDTVDKSNDSDEITDNDEIISPDIPPVVKVNKKYNAFISILDEWYKNDGIFSNPRHLKEGLCKIIYNMINWQQYGISPTQVKIFETAPGRLFSFERQDKTNENSLINLPCNSETYDLFLSVGKWLYLGEESWDFEESQDSIYIFSYWIEKNKNNIFNAINKKITTPNYIKLSMINTIYKMIYCGELDVKKIDDINVSDLLVKYKPNAITSHNDHWNEIVKLCNEVKNGRTSQELYLDYFNIKQGAGGAKYFLNYYTLEKAFKEIKRKHFIPDETYFEKNVFKDTNDVINFYSDLSKRNNKVIIEEQKAIVENISILYNLMGYDIEYELETEDIKQLIDDISEYYNYCEKAQYIFTHKSSDINDYKNKSSIIVKLINLIKNTDSNDVLSALLTFSLCDTSLLLQFVALLKDVEKEVNYNISIIENDYNKYVAGSSPTSIDSRFEKYENVVKDLNLNLEV